MKLGKYNNIIVILSKKKNKETSGPRPSRIACFFMISSAFVIYLDWRCFLRRTRNYL